MPRELLAPEIIFVMLSIAASAALERRKLLGAELLVVFSAAYTVSACLAHNQGMVIPWAVFTIAALLYFSKWKSWESDVPYAWLVSKSPGVS